MTMPLRIALLLGSLALVALVALVRPTPACADSWELPKQTTYTSCGSHSRLIVTPRALEDQLAYFDDLVEDHPHPGQRKGGTPAVTAQLERRTGKQWQPIWQGKLVNDVAPVDVIVRDDGSYAVTFDDWHGMGFGPHVVVIYNHAGKLVRALALTDIVPRDYIETMPHSISSIWWRTTPRFATGADLVIIPVVLPGSSPDDLGTVEFAVNLTNGKVTPVDQTAWAAAQAASKAMRARQLANTAAAKAAFLAPLLGPKINEEGPWHHYLQEAVARTEGDGDGAYTTVLRLPDADDYAVSEQWVRDGLSEGLPNNDQNTVAFAALLPAQLVQVLQDFGPRLPAKSLTHTTVYLALSDAYWPRAAAALAHTGARLVQLDPTRPIPQRPERIASRRIERAQ